MEHAVWFLKIICYSTIWATQPCDIYRGPVTATLAELNTFHSRLPIDSNAMCDRVGLVIAEQDRQRTGNEYEAVCVRP